MSSAIWVVTYRKGKTSQVWLAIAGVPPSTTRRQVSEALEGWSGWDRYQAAPGGSITLRRDDTAAVKGSPVKVPAWVAWEQLPDGRKTVALRVDVPGNVHSAMRRKVRAEGTSLQQWALQVLTAAVGAE